MEMHKDVLWEGKPKKGFQLVLEDLIIIPFLSFCGFVIYFISRGNFLILVLFALVFFYLIYMRYIKDIVDRQHTEYWITPTEVVISIRNKTTPIYFSSMKKVSCTEHPFTFKYGSIIFGEEENIFGNPNQEFSFGRHGGLNLQRNKITISFIKDYKKVYALIQENIKKNTPV